MYESMSTSTWNKTVYSGQVTSIPPSGRHCTKKEGLCDMQDENYCDEVIHFQHGEKLNVVDYLNEISEEIRQPITSYLSSGETDVLNINEGNLHYFFHTATFLHHEPLAKVCYSFFIKCRQQSKILSTMCECCQEAMTTYNIGVTSRSSSVLSLNEESISPAYAILFLKPNDEPAKGSVIIMNYNNKYEILQQTVRKVTKFGAGFASCSTQIDDSPHVLISGGTGKTSNALWKYDVIVNKWTECASLVCARSNHMMASIGKQVYIIGGQGCDRVEMYTPSKNVIATVAHLSIIVHSAAFVVYEDKVFVFGGKSKLGKVNCVQCIDTRTNQVCRLNDLPCQCSGGQAVVVNDKVFYATGQGHMIIFDPSSGHSELCAQQPFRRKQFAIFERNNKVFIFGGVRTDDSSQESTMCKYCPKKDVWIKKVLSFKTILPIYTSCIVRYPKKCPVIPFMDLYNHHKR